VSVAIDIAIAVVAVGSYNWLAILYGWWPYR
jgi:hypothetical protein